MALPNTWPNILLEAPVAALDPRLSLCNSPFDSPLGNYQRYLSSPVLFLAASRGETRARMDFHARFRASIIYRARLAC